MATNTIKRVLLAITISIVAIGCVKEADEQPLDKENLQEVVFHAGWAPETKTVLQEDGSVWWNPEDKIALFVFPECVTQGDDYIFCLESDCTEPSSKTDFVGKVNNGEGETTYYAIYPYDKAREWYSFTIPSVQYATAGGFSPGQFVSFARSTDNYLTFYNLCAGIKFSVAHEGISKVVFKNREDYYPITGAMKVTFWNYFPEDGFDRVGAEFSGASYSLTVYPAEGKYFIPGQYYYASLAPQYHSSLVISYYTDDKVATLCLNDRYLERSKIAVLAEKDKELTFEDNNNFSYALLSGYIQNNLLPSGIDKNTIEEVVFHTSSDITTETVIPASIPYFVQRGYYDIEYTPVYFELIGSTAHYYTKADRYMMSGHSICFTDWAELRSVDLSMFCTNQVTDFSNMFLGCLNLENVNLSSFDTSNARTFADMFGKCNKLRKLDISNFSSKNAFWGGEWWEPFDGFFNNCHSLVALDLGNFDISGKVAHGMSSFARNSHNCAIRCTPSTREALSNFYSRLGSNAQYITWILPEEDIPDLEPYRFDYYSTDYSKDKTFRVLQRASVGNGINIVLMGDGYSDRMINDGTYDEDMTKAMNAIFKDEPYASFKELFNVYEVYAVSENEIPGESNTAIRSFIGGIDPINGAIAYHEDYYLKKYAQISNDDINETCIVLVLNQEPGIVAGTATQGWIMEGDDVNDVTDYAKGGSVVMACRGRQRGDDYYSFVVSHEFGHGFAKLADEYISYGGTMNDGEKEEYLRLANNYGWWSNLDITDEPATIKWSRFLNDERYAGTVGIYEGATYTTGCWRPSVYSIMHNDAVGSMFNAPSREAIYKRIHRLAFGKEWQYDYEEFVEYDQKNIEAERTSLTAPMVLRRPAYEILGKPFMKIEKSISPDGQERIRVIMN